MYRKITLEENGKIVYELRKNINGNNILEEDIVSFLKILDNQKNIINLNYIKRLLKNEYSIFEIICWLQNENNRNKYRKELIKCLKNI